MLLQPSVFTSKSVTRLRFPGCRRSLHRRFLFKPIFLLNNDKWKLSDNLSPELVQETLSSWLLKAQSLIEEVKSGKAKNTKIENELENIAVKEEMFIASELTVERKMADGFLSFDAVVSIEQFARCSEKNELMFATKISHLDSSYTLPPLPDLLLVFSVVPRIHFNTALLVMLRMNGLTGRKMQKIFRALAADPVRNDARSLVEYCCFRYLSRDSSDFHPSLKELAFQRLIFITMLAWEHPYSDTDELQASLENSSLQMRLVGEEAFSRIAPKVAGVADISTAHHLFKALAGNESGISLSTWTTYIAELIKVHQGRKSYQSGDILMSDEQLLCVGSSKKRPVLKWENNVAWPGNLTLTDNALYFEVIGLNNNKQPIRLDLTRGCRVEKARVGPFKSKLFDSAVSVSSCDESEPWVLEFVDFGGELRRRDVWHAFISEIVSLYKFIHEYGPKDDDPTIHHVYDAHKGKRKAIKSVANSIARLQALQFIKKLAEDPAKLVQFSYLQNVPYGEVVLQTLAVNFWGGPMITKFGHEGPINWVRPANEIPFGNVHVHDIDGSVYLRKWMRSPTWFSSSSVTFWKSSIGKKGVVLGKNLVVGDLNLVEKASLTCKERSLVVEKTQATIDAALIQGIPSNIDLFKELMLPGVVIAKQFDKLRRWEDPRSTISFLAFAYFVIFRNLLKYVVPTTLIVMATMMLLLRSLKEQGRVGRSFGRVTIRDQPPSNTLEKIIALKEAMADMENYLQHINVSLLKMRTIVLSGQPEITKQVALVLLGGAVTLLVVPFNYLLAFGLLDLFTRKLEFRKEMVLKFTIFLREKWASVHAAPVVVLPYVNEDRSAKLNGKEKTDQPTPKRIQGNEATPSS